MSKLPLALLLTPILAACAEPEDPPAVSEAAQSMVAYPADKRSLWTTSEGRVIHYYIDVDRQVSFVSPAQSSCASATPGTRGDEQLAPETVTSIHEGLKKYEEQTPLRFTELRSLPIDDKGKLTDPGYDVLVFTRWDTDGQAHGSAAPPPGEVLSCVYFPPAPNSRPFTTQHEVAHNLGMTHEQTRSDRDDWIVVSELACADATAMNDLSRNLTPYDYTTIMHSNSRQAAGCEYNWLKKNCDGLACCTNADATCGCPGGTECRVVGAGEDFSLEDINALYEAYPPKLNDLAQDDRYGAAMASGDFDNDGYQDLAIGAPGAALPDHPASGVVFVYKGTYLGLVPWKTLAQEEFRVGDEGSDEFGAALAAGDVDGDGVADLVVGAPSEGVSGFRGGAIFLFQGIQAVSAGEGGTAVAGGLTLEATVCQSSFSGYADHEGDRVGAAVEIAKVQSGVQVLVGAPGTSNKAGSVYILTWNAATTALALSKKVAGQSGSEFGTDVRAGQLDSSIGDKNDDMVVGAPGASPSGKIFLYKGSATGVTSAGSIEAELAGITMSRGSSSRFGTAIRLGRFHNETGKNQIAVGAPSRPPAAASPGPRPSSASTRSVGLPRPQPTRRHGPPTQCCSRRRRFSRTSASSKATRPSWPNRRSCSHSRPPRK